MKPFLKWVGGKRRQADFIVNKIGDPLDTKSVYIEPFLGSGAILGKLAENKDGFTNFILNDQNTDLYNVYTHLRYNYDSLLQYLNHLFAEPFTTQNYTICRNLFNSYKQDDLKRAATFILLNRWGYNGLCRYNSKGEFNVPKGKYKQPKIPILPILEWHKFFWDYDHDMRNDKSIAIENQDFEPIMDKAKVGDVIYLDPPYYPESKTARFTNYNGTKWVDERDHLRLAGAIKRATNKGIKVVLSNSANGYTQDLYREMGGTQYLLPSRRSLSCQERYEKDDLLMVWN